MGTPRAAQSLHDELGPELWREILQTFVDGLSERLEAIHAAVEAGDAPLLADEAHSFKGSCLTLELDDLSASSRRIEVAAQAGEILHAEVAELERLAQAIATEIRQQLRS